MTRSSKRPKKVTRCRSCACTDEDCSLCYARTGKTCTWFRPGLCSACRGGSTVLVYVPPAGEPLCTIVLAATGPALDVAMNGQYLADLGPLGDHLAEVLDGHGEGLWLLSGKTRATPVQETGGQEIHQLHAEGKWTAKDGRRELG